MSTGPTIFEVGTTIGDYKIISVVGRGGMGKVFKVRNLLSDLVGNPYLEITSGLPVIQPQLRRFVQSRSPSLRLLNELNVDPH